MASVLVTGASGFVGEHLARGFSGLDRLYLACGARRPRAKADRVFQADLASRGSFTRALGDLEVDVVIHAAALSTPDACEKDPDLAAAINTDGTEEVARWAAGRRARLIYLSTDQVFDGRKGSYDEQDAPCPLNTYGRTKLEGENRVARHCSDWVILRLALSYGPTLGSRGDWTQRLRLAVAEGKTLRLFTDQFRTPAYTAETAEAVRRLAHGAGSGLYHLGGAERLSRHAFGLRIARTFGLPAERLVPARMEEVPLAAALVRDGSLVSRRICAELGLAVCDVATGLDRQKKEEEALAAVRTGGTGEGGPA